MEIEESLKEISKAGLVELRSVSKPHQLVEKTLQIVCALKGFKNLSW
jgi:dynein heavy chain